MGSPHHEALVTPGSKPRLANSLKQMRHTAKRRKYPFDLPHRWQRFTARTLNFGVRFARSIHDVRAMRYRPSYFAANGNPNALSSAKASSRVAALVTMTMSIPMGK